MQREIIAVDVRPRPLAVVRITTVLSQWPSQFANELNKVYDAVRAGRVRQTGQNVMVYRPREDGRVDIECRVETDASFKTVGEVEFSETPEGLALTTADIGPCAQLSATHNALISWSRKKGCKRSGIFWEIYGDLGRGSAETPHGNLSSPRPLNLFVPD